MSSSEEKYQSNSSDNGLQIPGLVQNQEPVEQLSFISNPVTPFPASFRPLSSPGLTGLGKTATPSSNPGLTNPVTPLPDAPQSTRALILQSQATITKALAGVAPSTTPTSSLRPLLVVPGNANKKSRSIRPPQGRRHVIGIATLILLVVLTGGALLMASPLAREAGWGFNPLTTSNNIKGSTQTNLNLVSQQATATAVTYQQNDGYSPGAGSGGGQTYNTTGSPYPWPTGVCTYWANLRYHALTGLWVAWDGNAYQWADGAKLAGWNVSQTPHVPSIIVLMPGVQGASGYGHVAVVESMVNSTTVHTSNMNWYTNGGGWDIESYYNFTVGSGVYFVWHS